MSSEGSARVSAGLAATAPPVPLAAAAGAPDEQRRVGRRRYPAGQLRSVAAGGGLKEILLLQERVLSVNVLRFGLRIVGFAAVDGD